MKFLIICSMIAVAASAPQHFYGGQFAAPVVAYGHSFAPAIVKAPVYAAPVVAAPLVKHIAPAATSYQTFNQVHVTHPQPIVKYAAAPVVKYAAPVAPVVKYAAPLAVAAPAYAAAPVYGHGYGATFGNVYGHGY